MGNVSTGHKTFDRYFHGFSIGARIGGGQMSHIVRAFNRVKADPDNPNNIFHETHPKGYLQKEDMTYFYDAPNVIKGNIEMFAKENDIMVYSFYHYDRGKKTIHGYLITNVIDNTHENKELIVLGSYVTGPIWKSRLVIENAEKFLLLKYKGE